MSLICEKYRIQTQDEIKSAQKVTIKLKQLEKGNDEIRTYTLDHG